MLKSSWVEKRLTCQISHCCQLRSGKNFCKNRNPCYCFTGSLIQPCWRVNATGFLTFTCLPCFQLPEYQPVNTFCSSFEILFGFWYLLVHLLLTQFWRPGADFPMPVTYPGGCSCFQTGLVSLLPFWFWHTFSTVWFFVIKTFTVHSIYPQRLVSSLIELESGTFILPSSRILFLGVIPQLKVLISTISNLIGPDWLL